MSFQLETTANVQMYAPILIQPIQIFKNREPAPLKYCSILNRGEGNPK